MHQYYTSTGVLNVHNSDAITILAWWPGYCLSARGPWTSSPGGLIGVARLDGICYLLSVPLPGILIPYYLLQPSQIHAFPLKGCKYDLYLPQGRSGSPWHPGPGVAAGGRGLPTEDGDHPCLFLLGQSFSLSMGWAGGCSTLSITWPHLFVLVWLWLFCLCLYFIGSNSWSGYVWWQQLQQQSF